MKYCNHCKISVNTSNTVCPLCYGTLEDKETTKPLNIFPARTENIRVEKNANFLIRLFFFMSLVSGTICVYVNIVSNSAVMWSLVVITSMMYMWILICHTIISKRPVYEKILFQIFFIFLVLFICEMVFSGGNWMLNYVMPSICIGTTFILNFVSLLTNKKHGIVTSCLIMYIIIALLDLIILLVVKLNYTLLMQISLIYAVISIVGTFLFGWKIIKSDFQKNMHI